MAKSPSSRFYYALVILRSVSLQIQKTFDFLIDFTFKVDSSTGKSLLFSSLKVNPDSQFKSGVSRSSRDLRVANPIVETTKT